MRITYGSDPKMISQINVILDNIDLQLQKNRNYLKGYAKSMHFSLDEPLLSSNSNETPIISASPPNQKPNQVLNQVLNQESLHNNKQ